MISIVVPSVGHIGKLTTLFASLQNQRNLAQHEVLLSVTNPDPQLIHYLPSLKAPVRIISSPEKCISMARNRGIEQAQGDVLLFIDEDCYLPHPNYLNQLQQEFDKNKKLCGGGYYLSEQKTLGLFSRFYNYFCNFWVSTHLVKEQFSEVLLGGCAFYAKDILNTHNIRFSALHRRAGEEYRLNSKVTEKGYSLHLNGKWSVYHNPQCTFRNLYSKAWNQGRSLDEKCFNSNLSSSRFLKYLFESPLESLYYSPLFVTYLLVGRTAHWLQVFKKTNKQAATISYVHSDKV